jgi:hypothetical protein
MDIEKYEYFECYDCNINNKLVKTQCPCESSYCSAQKKGVITITKSIILDESPMISHNNMGDINDIGSIMAKMNL